MVLQYLMNDEERVWAGVCQAALYVWIAWLLALVSLRRQETHSPALPGTGGPYLQSGCGVETEVGHNDMEHLYVCMGSHKFLFYSASAKDHTG